MSMLEAKLCAGKLLIRGFWFLKPLSTRCLCLSLVDSFSGCLINSPVKHENENQWKIKCCHWNWKGCFKRSLKKSWLGEITCREDLIAYVLTNHALMIVNSFVVVFVLPSEHWRSAERNETKTLNWRENARRRCEAYKAIKIETIHTSPIIAKIRLFVRE